MFELFLLVARWPAAIVRIAVAIVRRKILGTSFQLWRHGLLLVSILPALYVVSAVSLFPETFVSFYSLGILFSVPGIRGKE